MSPSTGRFNLARGVVATLTGIAASLSTTISGLVAEAFGQTASFLAMAGVAAAAAATLWLLFPESRPAGYPD